MDHYQFPHITNIGQVLAVIKDKPEFIVKEADRHTIVNYVMAGNDTFPRVHRQLHGDGTTIFNDYNAALLRECRGIVFGPDGSVIARRLHKFFNCGEKEENALEGMDFTRKHNILEKLDGSMITPIPICRPGQDTFKHGYTLRWGTKMGLTHVAFQAEEFIAEHPEYQIFAHDCIYMGVTPIFEWCSRKQRIVIDHPQDRLILIAVRNNITGDYMPYETMWNLGRQHSIPVVATLPGESIVNGEEFVAGVREKEDIEGYVVRFNDGHMTKIKGEWYCRIHRAKDSILQEKRVVEMIVNEKVDDVLPFLLEHDKKMLQRYVDDFTKGLMESVDAIWTLYQRDYKRYNGDKKAFALDSIHMLQTLRSTIFAVWGKHDHEVVIEHVKSFIRKNLGSLTKVNGVRWLWGGYKWADYIQMEDEGA